MVGALFWMAMNRQPGVQHHDAEAIRIHVRAYRWRWEFEQPNGLVEGELHVPVNRTVRLLITSEPNGPESPAVIHQLSIPALGVRALVLPGQTTEVTFIAERLGRHAILCTELCGAGHSRMINAVEVMRGEEYDRGPLTHCSLVPDVPPEQWGEQLFASHGCSACHGVDGREGGVGPDLMNDAGCRTAEAKARVLAEDAYLRRAIEQPEIEIIAGYGDAAMPRYDLPQSQMDALLAYLRWVSVVPRLRGARQPADID